MVKSLVLASLLASSIAPSLARAEPPAETADTDTVEPETALRISVIGSALPLAMMGLGTAAGFGGSNNAIRDFGSVVALGGALLGIVTPSAGELSSHQWLNPGMAMRAGGLVVEAIGLVKGFNTEIGDCSDEGPSCHIHASTIGMLIGGAALYFGGMAVDIVDAPSAARAWNHRHELQVMPTALRSTSSTSPGLAVSVTF